MKNIKLIIAALASFAALSCEKESLPQNNSETIQETEMIPLILSSGESTKTHVFGKEIYWDLGDQIEVFSDKTRYDGGLSFSSSNNTTFSIDNNSISDKFAKFTGNVPKGTTKIWAVYPAGNASSCETDGTNMQVTLPIVQNAVANTFDNNLNISVAKAEVSNTDSRNEFDPQTTSVPVNFENVCSFLKFTTPGTDNTQSADISKVILSSNTAIAGSLVIDPATPKVTSSSSTSITMSGSFKQNTEYWFVIAKSGDELNGLSLTVVTTSGDVYCWAISGQTTLKTGQYRSIGKISLNENHKITLSAHHNYDTSGYLTGTDVSVKCGTTVLTPSTYSIKRGGSEKRNQNTTNYPYLPKGTGYTYEGTVTWNQVNVAVPQMSFVVPEPSIAVSEFTPFTSYSKYLENKLKEANSLDGSTIYVNVTHNISPNIIANTNYSQLITVEGNTPVYNSDKSCVCFAGKDWKSHTVSEITWTFDGVDASCKLETPVTVDVTGIPERLTLYGNQSGADASSWSFNNVKWEAGKCIIFHNGNDGNMISPCFYVPQDKSIGVNCSYGAQYYVGFINIAGIDVDEFSADVRVGLTSDKSAVSTLYKSHTLVASKNFGESFYQITDSFDLTHSLCYVSFHHNSPAQPKRKPVWLTYSANYWYINLQKVNVEYR